MKKRMVLIEWVDSHGATAGWQALEDFQCTALHITTVGFVVAETADAIAVAGSYAEETPETLEQANGVITIPKQAIISSESLALLLRKSGRR